MVSPVSRGSIASRAGYVRLKGVLMPTVKPLTPQEAKGTLAARLGSRVDRLRQIATNLGIRPYNVFLTWVVYSGQERGEGVASIFKRIQILPNPKITNLDTLTYVPQALGSLALGSLRVEKISPVAFTEDLLSGILSGSEEIPSNMEFFYELQQDGRGDNPAYRHKFKLASVPFLQPGKEEYTVILERIGGSDLDRDGQLPEPECLLNPG